MLGRCKCAEREVRKLFKYVTEMEANVYGIYPFLDKMHSIVSKAVVMETRKNNFLK